VTDGIFIGQRRPKSKKEVKEAITADPSQVIVECTSMFGGFAGRVSELPEGTTITFVGPDPYTKRNFYGNIKRKGDKISVT
jgi:hypothetical protein